MILAQKIVKLRKKIGWSQEELAAKMSVSRQSVSKWESTNSIPDLNKIILLSELFSVSTDFLLKDEHEIFDSQNKVKDTETTLISMEQAVNYVEAKTTVSSVILKGVLLCVCSVVPLFFFLALAAENRLGLTGDIATGLGVVSILIMLCLAVNLFLKANQFDDVTSYIDNEKFDLAYGVHSVFTERLKEYKPSYNRRLSLGIFMFIFSFAPLMFVSMFYSSASLILMMVIVLMLMVAFGLYIVIPVSAKYDAYNKVLTDHQLLTEKSKRTKRAEQLAVFYWPLITAIYVGWSLWTMNWGVTWIIWPVASILFIALLGLMELLEKDSD